MACQYCGCEYTHFHGTTMNPPPYQIPNNTANCIGNTTMNFQIVNTNACAGNPIIKTTINYAQH